MQQFGVIRQLLCGGRLNEQRLFFEGTAKFTSVGSGALSNHPLRNKGGRIFHCRKREKARTFESYRG